MKEIKIHSKVNEPITMEITTDDQEETNEILRLAAIQKWDITEIKQVDDET
jgi:hypothetical protein